MKHAQADHFWDWFQKNHHRLKDIKGQSKEEMEYWHRELVGHLRSYSGGDLFPHVIVDDKKDRAGMIISAGSNPKYFDKVEQLVAKAPPIEGWSFVALMPPMPANSRLAHDYPSVTIQPGDMFFAPDELVLVDGRYNLEVYVGEETPIDKELLGAATQVVMNILGEKNAGLFVREVAVNYLTDAPLNLQYTVVPLPQLPNYISSEKLSGIMVNDKGAMKPRIRK
jgi:hypothetical protein